MFELRHRIARERIEVKFFIHTIKFKRLNTIIFNLTQFNERPLGVIQSLNYTPIISHKQRWVYQKQGWVCHKQSWVCHKQDRKSTRLNSSHVAISYAVFCLKKK